MKKYALSSCLVLLLLLVGVACSSDDNATTPEESLLVGVWKPAKGDGEVCSSGNETFETPSTCVQKSRITFYADGTFDNTDFDDWTGTCKEYDKEYGTWVLNGDQLSVTSEHYDEEDIEEMTVIKLSSNTLRLGFYSDEEDMTGSCADGSSVSYYFMEFKRVQ